MHKFKRISLLTFLESRDFVIHPTTKTSKSGVRDGNSCTTTTATDVTAAASPSFPPPPHTC